MLGIFWFFFRFRRCFEENNSWNNKAKSQYIKKVVKSLYSNCVIWYLLKLEVEKWFATDVPQIIFYSYSIYSYFYISIQNTNAFLMFSS